MAPSATEPPAQTSLPRDALPPPRTYAPRDAHFEAFIEPQRDGYRKAKSKGSDKVAIVIDNGLDPRSLRMPCLSIIDANLVL
jgi:actin-related protein 5